MLKRSKNKKNKSFLELILENEQTINKQGSVLMVPDNHQMLMTLLGPAGSYSAWNDFLNTETKINDREKLKVEEYLKQYNDFHLLVQGPLFKDPNFINGHSKETEFNGLREYKSENITEGIKILRDLEELSKTSEVHVGLSKTEMDIFTYLTYKNRFSDVPESDIMNMLSKTHGISEKTPELIKYMKPEDLDFLFDKGVFLTATPNGIVQSGHYQKEDVESIPSFVSDMKEKDLLETINEYVTNPNASVLGRMMNTNLLDYNHKGRILKGDAYYSIADFNKQGIDFILSPMNVNDLAFAFKNGELRLDNNSYVNTRKVGIYHGSSPILNHPEKPLNRKAYNLVSGAFDSKDIIRNSMNIKNADNAWKRKRSIKEYPEKKIVEWYDAVMSAYENEVFDEDEVVPDISDNVFEVPPGMSDEMNKPEMPLEYYGAGKDTEHPDKTDLKSKGKVIDDAPKIIYLNEHPPSEVGKNSRKESNRKQPRYSDEDEILTNDIKKTIPEENISQNNISQRKRFLLYDPEADDAPRITYLLGDNSDFFRKIEHNLSPLEEFLKNHINTRLSNNNSRISIQHLSRYNSEEDAPQTSYIGSDKNSDFFDKIRSNLLPLEKFLKYESETRDAKKEYQDARAGFSENKSKSSPSESIFNGQYKSETSRDHDESSPSKSDEEGEMNDAEKIYSFVNSEDDERSKTEGKSKRKEGKSKPNEGRSDLVDKIKRTYEEYSKLTKDIEREYKNLPFGLGTEKPFSGKDEYEKLGVDESAAPSAICAAYKSLKQRYDPKKQSAKNLKNIAEAVSKEIEEAYENMPVSKKGAKPDYDRIPDYIRRLKSLIDEEEYNNIIKLNDENDMKEKLKDYEGTVLCLKKELEMICKRPFNKGEEMPFSDRFYERMGIYGNYSKKYNADELNKIRSALNAKYRMGGDFFSGKGFYNVGDIGEEVTQNINEAYENLKEGKTQTNGSKESKTENKSQKYNEGENSDGPNSGSDGRSHPDNETEYQNDQRSPRVWARRKIHIRRQDLFDHFNKTGGEKPYWVHVKFGKDKKLFPIYGMYESRGSIDVRRYAEKLKQNQNEEIRKNGEYVSNLMDNSNLENMFMGIYSRAA